MIPACVCCGSHDIVFTSVLWPELIAEWRLAPHEAEYIDRQQGTHCAACGSNLRTMALARAILSFYGQGRLFRDFMNEAGRRLEILEINEAGQLTQFLSRAPAHRIARYPEVDMQSLRYPDGSFDLIVHSDTLEHVERPVTALAECRRALRPGGACAFTVPIVVGRLTLSRVGMPASYHAGPQAKDAGLVVRTEYGADAWTHVVQAGFRECRLTSLEFPTAVAMVGVA
jgi:SAM-dependent methyltransferase